jgi:hypothetical protein
MDPDCTVLFFSDPNCTPANVIDDIDETTPNICGTSAWTDSTCQSVYYSRA